MPVVPVPPSAASFAGTHSTCSANTTKSEVKLPRQMHTSATSPRAPPRIFRCRFVLYAPAACARALLLGLFSRLCRARPMPHSRLFAATHHPPSYAATTPRHTAHAQHARSVRTALSAAEGLCARWSGLASPCRRPLFSLGWTHSLLPPSSSTSSAEPYVLVEATA